MSANNVECEATKEVSISLLSDCKVNLVTIDGRDTLEAKRDVACLLRRHIYTRREYFADQVPVGNKFSRKGKEFSAIGDINVLRVRHLGSSQQTYLPYALCINILLLRVYINLIRATWVYIALEYASHEEQSIRFHQFHIYELLAI